MTGIITAARTFLTSLTAEDVLAAIDSDESYIAVPVDGYQRPVVIFKSHIIGLTNLAPVE